MNSLLKQFADQSDKLFKLQIIRTDSFTGEIGEFVAKEHFNLKLADKVARAIDGTDAYGYKYQIKSKVITNKGSLRVTNLEIYEKISDLANLGLINNVFQYPIINNQVRTHF